MTALRLRSFLAWAGIVLVAVALAWAGARLSLTGRGWLDTALSVVWLVTASLAMGRLARHPGLLLWAAGFAGAAGAGLALQERQLLPAALALAGVLAGGAARLAALPGPRAVAGHLSGMLLASAAILLAFPDRPQFSTWMVPLLLMGVPLVFAAYDLAAQVRRLWRGSPYPSDLVGHLQHNGYTPAGARRVLAASSFILSLAAFVAPHIHPFLANLALLVLAALAFVAGRPRALRQTGLGPALIYSYASVVLVLFVTSVRFGYLDPLFSETLSGYEGWDYFLMPRAFDCFIAGHNMYEPYPDPAHCTYGPWATPFVLHPLAAVVPGAVLWALPPWTSYWVFIAASIGSLGLLYWLFAGLTANSLHRSLIFAALFANWPLYLMLWLGQTQIFTVVSFGLVGYWLLRQFNQPVRRLGWLLTIGLLISLFTKPMVMLLLPALLIAPLTRRPALVASGIYALVSAMFVLVPALNPGQLSIGSLAGGRLTLDAYAATGNLHHWANILVVSSSLHTNHRDIHVLSNLLNAVLPDGVVIIASRVLTLLTTGLVTWWAAQTRFMPPAHAARTLALCATLMIALYYLTYTFAFEHQYPTLVIAPVVFLLVLPHLESGTARRWLVLALGSSAPLLLPTIYRLVVHNPVRDILYDFSAETLEQMTIYKSFRVIPVLLMFIFNFMALRRLRLAGSAQPS